MIKRSYFAIFLFIFIPQTVPAFCFEEAGAEYGISPLLLWSIAKHESNFNPGAIGRNRNGTYDYGLMQINSSWAKRLGNDLWRNLGDPCTNVKTGAWILSQCIRRHGYTWKAVGCYNSNTPGKRERYAGCIARTLAKAGMQLETLSPAENNGKLQTELLSTVAGPRDDIPGSPL